MCRVTYRRREPLKAEPATASPCHPPTRSSHQLLPECDIRHCFNHPRKHPRVHEWSLVPVRQSGQHVLAGAHGRSQERADGSETDLLAGRAASPAHTQSIRGRASKRTCGHMRLPITSTADSNSELQVMSDPCGRILLNLTAAAAAPFQTAVRA